MIFFTKRLDFLRELAKPKGSDDVWNTNGNAIRMVEGEYGVDLPLTITGVTLTANGQPKRGRMGTRSVTSAHD